MKPARAARLLFQLPQGSRVYRRIEPGNAWGWQEVLLNKIEYAAQVLAWQNANMGKKKSEQSEKPELFRPPFMVKQPKDPEMVVADIEDIRHMLPGMREQ